MAKKIIKFGNITKKVIKEQQRLKIITESIEYDPRHPEKMHPSIEKELRQDTHHFKQSSSFPGTGGEQKYSEKVASKRFKDIITMVKRYHGIETIEPSIMMQMMSIMGDVSKIEGEHVEELEQLAIDIVSEEFDIPEDMLRAQLLPPGSPIDLDGEDDDSEEEEDEPFVPKSAARMKELDVEVEKRSVINAMMQGASKKGHYIFHQVVEELDQIDPRLMGLYGKLMSLADFQYWVIPDQLSDGGIVGGKEEIKWEKPEGEEDAPEEPVVEAKAWIFPLLVHELIKGVMELAAIGWAEGHMEPDEQAHVISRADTIPGEIWGMRLGPGIWEKFLECMEDEDYKIKHWIFEQLTKLPAKKFHSFMQEILSSSQECKKVITQLRELHQESEEDSLEDIVTGDEDSFEDGLDDLLGDVGIAPQEDTPEDTTPSKEIDYSEMTSREIQQLIDDALDAEDFDTVSKLHKYL
jgi:hypothetical protein